METTASFNRVVTEDAAVGAYIVMIDGDRRESARALVRGPRCRMPNATMGTC